MKKIIIILLAFTLVTTMITSTLASSNTVEIQTETVIEATETNTEEKHLFDLSPATLENLGVDERYLQKIGFTKEEAISIIKNNFKNIKEIADRKGVDFLLKTANLTITIMATPDQAKIDWQECTVDGVPGQLFHPDVNISQMSTYVNKTKSIAKDLFGYSSLTNIHCTNYMWGEYNPNIGVHEGIDIRYTANDNESFRTIVSGTVKRVEKDGTGIGALAVYLPGETSTYFFLHAIDYDDSIIVNYPINGDYFLCYQGGTKNGAQVLTEHVHIQVESGEKTTCSSGSDTNLTSHIPYDKFYTYVDPFYK